MLSKLLVAVLTVSSLVGIGQLFDSPALASQSPFFCDTKEDVPTTRVRTNSRGDERLIEWHESFGKEFTPANRCRIVTDRLNKAYNTGRTRLIPRRVNGLPVICSVSMSRSCNAKDVLFTLKNDRDVQQVLSGFNYLIRGASNIPPLVLDGKDEDLSEYERLNYYVDLKVLIGNE
jgi:hypothetical protein